MSNTITITAATGEDMQALGERLAKLARGGDVLLLSGPLGAGKTTFAQGFGAGLGIGEPIVSPTFTIARELEGRFADGSPAHLVHVDAYRLGGNAYAPGQDTVGRLLDELESLGLDEELEDPGEHTVILMEWGEQMASTLLRNVWKSISTARSMTGRTTKPRRGSRQAMAPESSRWYRSARRGMGRVSRDSRPRPPDDGD